MNNEEITKSIPVDWTVILIFPEGDTRIYYSPYRIYGVKVKNKRPIKAIVNTGYSDELLKSIDHVLNPLNRKIIYV